MRSEWHWFVRCDLQIFSGCVCHLEQLHAQSPFLFPIVFSINKPFGLHVVSSIQVWKTFFSFDERNLREESKSRDSTNDGSTWRFLLVARHAATLGLWHAIPQVGELPFLKGFSLWTNQSERVYFYWPPGPNPVVTISTRVGPGSRLTLGLLVRGDPQNEGLRGLQPRALGTVSWITSTRGLLLRGYTGILKLNWHFRKCLLQRGSVPCILTSLRLCIQSRQCDDQTESGPSLFSHKNHQCRSMLNSALQRTQVFHKNNVALELVSRVLLNVRIVPR